MTAILNEDREKQKKSRVGSGTIYLEGWLNVDLPSPESGCALAKDNPEKVRKWLTAEDDYFGRHNKVSIENIGKGIPVDNRNMVCDAYGSFDALPCEDGEADEVLSRQVFEHLSIREAKAAAMECRRVLCDGGILRLDVPDFEASLESYRDGIDDAFFKRHIFGSRKNAASYHIIGWTRESLVSFFDDYGFEFVEEEKNIHFYPAFCIRFRKGSVAELDGPPIEAKPFFAAWEYCGDNPGEPLRAHSDYNILEVGCGRRPWPAANQYVDIEDVRDTLPFEKQDSFLQGDVTSGLPNDWTGKFDYVFASHILEHIDEPRLVAAELSRVARAGCVVCPSAMKDAIFNFHEADHRWWALPCSKPNTIRLLRIDQEWRDAVFNEDVSKAMHQMYRLEKKRFEPEGRTMREWFAVAEPHLDVIVKWDHKLNVEILR